MAFGGYLMKFGSKDLSTPIHHYIAYETYEAAIQVQDLDSYRNANGVLVRNALEHKAFTVEFTTIPNLNTEKLNTILNLIQKNYTIQLERKLSLTAYMPEEDDYVTKDVYLVEPKFKIRKITNTEVIYDAIKFKFIAY